MCTINGPYERKSYESFQIFKVDKFLAKFLKDLVPLGEYK